MRSDICILGAGPGGVATALRLSYLGIPSVLIDKAEFPRDKICGDAISGKVTTLLNRLDPEILQRFNAEPVQVDIWGVRFVAPNSKVVDIPFKEHYIRDAHNAPGYVSKRVDFDNFLIEEVKRRPDIRFFPGTEITQIRRTGEGFHVQTADGQFACSSHLLIMANGAHSRFSRTYAGLEKDPAHHAAAVRAYYKGVTGFSKEEFIELHFLKELTPGYFWVFPLPNGEANVGLGMRSDFVKKRSLNLRECFLDVIENHPKIAPRFKAATLAGKVEGYGLPLGSKKQPVSGDHFMLVGDAGHLIDPLTGEGIGNAFYSGFIAAEQAEKCLKENNFSAAFLEDYDIRVARVLGEEMRLSYKLQQIGAYPYLVNIIANIIHRNRKVLNYLSDMYTDFNLREQLAKPWFWMKMLLKK